MKFLWTWSWKWEDYKKENELSDKFDKAMKENPKQFPKMLTKTCFTGRGSGFRIIEAENEDQLANLVTLWWSTEEWKLEVILESQGEAMQKAWTKWNA